MSVTKNFYDEYFLTSYNIPIRSPPPSIQFENKLNDKKTSILLDYESEIKTDLDNDKIKKNIIDKIFNKENKNNKMIYLSESFERLLILNDNPTYQDILKFSKIYSLFNTSEKNLIINTKILEKILKNIKDKDFLNEFIPVQYKNPIQIYNFNIDQNYILKNKLSEIFNKIYDDRFKDFAINSINNIYFGNYMDMSLPSIGPLYTIFDYSSNLNKFSNINIYNFFIKIINNNDNFIDSLPIKHTHLEKTISKLLLKKTTNSDDIFSLDFNKNINGINEETRLESIIENSIIGIKFSLNDVLKDGNKETSKIKNEYILPYIMRNNKIEKLKDLGEAGDKTKVSEILKHNRNVVSKIIDLYTNKRSDFDDLCRKEPLLEENMKNCLGVFVYISISIFYDVYKYYFDKLTEILNEFIENDRFKISDVKPVFNFVDKIKKSLYNFKKILENCFYHLFLPSRLTPKYGVRINKEKGYFEIENKLLADFNHIILNFPFEFMEELKRINNNPESQKIDKYIINIENSKNRFINFALSHKSIYDIVNPEEQLFIGTFMGNAKTTYDIYTTIYYKYLESIYIQSKFNIILLKYFMASMKVKVPIELFKIQIALLENIKNQLKSSEYSDSIKKEINNIIIENYNNNYKFSTNCLIHLAKIKRDMIILNKDKQTEVYEYSLNSLLFYHEALVYEYIFEQDINDRKFKESKFKIMTELKNYYEKEILRVSKEVQNEILNKQERNSEKLKSNESNDSNESIINKNKNQNIKLTNNKNNNILLKIKKLIEKNDILIPYNLNGKIYFISLFNNTDNLLFNQNLNTNKHLILLGESTNDVLKNKLFRILKEEEFNKLKNMDDLNKTKYLIEFISDKEKYLELTELSTDNLFKIFVENNCNIGCDQVLLSFNQLKKIMNLKK